MYEQSETRSGHRRALKPLRDITKRCGIYGFFSRRRTRRQWKKAKIFPDEMKTTTKPNQTDDVDDGDDDDDEESQKSKISQFDLNFKSWRKRF